MIGAAKSRQRRTGVVWALMSSSQSGRVVYVGWVVSTSISRRGGAVKGCKVARKLVRPFYYTFKRLFTQHVLSSPFIAIPSKVFVVVSSFKVQTQCFGQATTLFSQITFSEFFERLFTQHRYLVRCFSLAYFSGI